MECVQFTLPYPEGTDRAWFNDGLLTAYLFQQTFEDAAKWGGPMTDAGIDPYTQQRQMMNGSRRVGIDFLDDGIRLSVAQWFLFLEDRDDWRVELTRLGP